MSPTRPCSKHHLSTPDAPRQPAGRTPIGLGYALVALVALVTVAALACTREEAPVAPLSVPPVPPAASGSETSAGLAPSGQPYSEEREACVDRDPRRQAFWGELHVHSALSMDAWMWDVRNGPDETYRFGKGEQILLPPLDAQGKGTRAVKLERPLDFVALTDHADFQGEVSLCTRPGSPVYDGAACRKFRGEDEREAANPQSFGKRMAGLSTALDADALYTKRSEELCGPDGAICREAMRTVWEEQQAAAERHYDRSAQCRFTTFHAYEYTATPGLAKVHHNVIFRNAERAEGADPVDRRPRRLRALVAAEAANARTPGTGCDVVTLPHNSNLSNGNMFAVTGRDLPLEEQRARALLRADIERLAEISQIKGASECRNGMFDVIGAPDELCDFEQWRGPQFEDCKEGTGKGALFDQGCVSRTDFLRYSLLEGFREQRRIGVNPYKLGIIAATDTHNATSGRCGGVLLRGLVGSLRRHGRAPARGAARADHPDEPGRFEPRRRRGGLGRGEFARFALRRDEAPGDLRNQRPTHDGALLRRLEPACGSLRDAGPGRARLCDGRSDGRRPAAATGVGERRPRSSSARCATAARPIIPADCSSAPRS